MNISMKPIYDLDKIKFATDRPTLEKAMEIYSASGVQKFKADDFGFAAKVRGSHGNFYDVCVSAKHYDEGNCDCYVGQNDTLCKHMVALAISAVKGGEKLSEDEKMCVSGPVCSGKVGASTRSELKEIKAEISSATHYVKPYDGPSRIWFAYQDSLSEGCNRLAAIISKLPVNIQTAKLLVGLLLRLDKKLCQGGVDDSDGTVGGFMGDVVVVLCEFAKLEPGCIGEFVLLCTYETGFEWEEPLVELVNKNNDRCDKGLKAEDISL